jgi:RNA polymerase sigma-70 factor, ECF subfamily
VYTEAVIVEGCRNNDPEFQKIVYEKYAPKMMTVCRRYTSNYEEARDLMHDGFLEVFTNFNSYKQKSNLDSWITRVIINNVIDNIRRKIKVEKAEKYFKKEYVLENTSTAEDSWMDNFTMEEIHEAILCLTFEKRTVFNLHIVDKFSHKEIARKLGISVGASKVCLYKAKQTLKELLLKKLNRR